MSEVVVRRQDMPPLGGYKEIPFERRPAKTYLGGKSLFAIYLAMTGVGVYVYNITQKKIKREEVEMRSAKFAVAPLLLAEADRLFLKHLRKNRDEEARLMANVPGWKVGTWYGEPIYKTVPKGTYIDPIVYEFYAHADVKEFKRRAEIALYT